jgi:hypothetical protein
MEEVPKKRRKRVVLTQIEINGEVFPAKMCTACDDIKVLSEFAIVAHGLGGRGSQCKACKTILDKDIHKDYRAKHGDMYRQIARNNRLKNRTRSNEQARKRRKDNGEKVRENARNYYHANKDQIKKLISKYKEHRREYMRDYMRNKRAAQKQEG